MKYNADKSTSTFVTCPECGKEFFCSNMGEWAYKRNYDSNTQTFCSWTCVRKYDRRRDEELQKRREEGKQNHFRGRRIAG